jgi:hypothetical protein
VIAARGTPKTSAILRAISGVQRLRPASMFDMCGWVVPQATANFPSFQPYASRRAFTVAPVRTGSSFPSMPVTIGTNRNCVKHQAETTADIACLCRSDGNDNPVVTGLGFLKIGPRNARHALDVSCCFLHHCAMDGSDRKRLAREVISRRVELGMKTTKALADKAGLSPRMLGDVENGRRDNFSPGAKAQIERALRWDAGSIDAVLGGKSPRVSNVIRDRSGREVEKWTSIEGSEQENLELYRLAYVIVDTRDLVRSQKGPLMTALTALLDEAADLVFKSVARRRSGRDDIEDLDLEDARWFIEETRETNNIRRQGSIYVTDDDEKARLSTDSTGAELDIEHGMDQAQRDFNRRRRVLKSSLLNHYGEMYRRAADQRRLKVLVDQAREQLGDEQDPDLTFAHEIGDAAYVEYLAAQLSTPHQGGDPDLYDAVSLNHNQYQAARARYRREFAEMIVFDGRLRTLGAPDVKKYAAANDSDLTLNDAPPDLADAARTAPPGYKGPGQAARDAQDEAGEESQDSD